MSDESRLTQLCEQRSELEKRIANAAARLVVDPQTEDSMWADDFLAWFGSEVMNLLLRAQVLEDLLVEFESLPVRRHTNETTVYERGALDAWRARCGKAVRDAD